MFFLDAYLFAFLGISQIFINDLILLIIQYPEDNSWIGR